MVGSVALPDEFSDSLKNALKVIKSASYLRVISHYDADGLAAAAVMVLLAAALSLLWFNRIV